MKFATSLLWVNGVLFALFGAAFVTAPACFANAITGVVPASPSALIDMRATYGGMGLGAGVFFGYCALRPQTVRLGLLASLLMLGGIASARLTGVLVDGTPNTAIYLLLGAELLFVGLIGAALWRIRGDVGLVLAEAA